MSQTMAGRQSTTEMQMKEDRTSFSSPPSTSSRTLNAEEEQETKEGFQGLLDEPLESTKYSGNVDQMEMEMVVEDEYPTGFRLMSLSYVLLKALCEKCTKFRGANKMI